MRESHREQHLNSCEWRSLFHHLHSLRTSAHLGSVRTFKNIRARFYWPGYKKDVLRWCKFCKPCATTKMRHGGILGDLRQQLSGAPMERIAMDFIGPLPRTAAGNEHLLVVCDYFTKWVECFPLPDQTASVTADVLVTQFFSRFGVPRIIHTDQGSNFESELFSNMCDLYGIEKTHTTPYHPRSDGLVERFSQRVLSCATTAVPPPSQQRTNPNLRQGRLPKRRLPHPLMIEYSPPPKRGGWRWNRGWT